MLSVEATQMIRGLGVYLVRKYGSKGIIECFSNEYWKALKGWKWSQTLEIFDTPESRQLHSNIVYDPNQLIMLMERQRLSKKKRKGKERKGATETEKDQQQAETGMVGQLTRAERVEAGKRLAQDKARNKAQAEEQVKQKEDVQMVEV